MSNQPPPADPNDKNAPQGGNTAPPAAGEQPAAEKEKITIEAPANAAIGAIISPADGGGEPPLDPPTRWQIILLGFYLVLIFVLLSYLLLKLWGKQDGEPLELFWGWYALQVHNEVKILVVAMVAGGLGSIFHAVKSYTSYVGNERIDIDWFSWYFLRPLSGIVLAAIFYFVLRAGLLTGQASSNEVSLYGVAAMAAMAGMFADQAALKLKEVFETLFKAEDPRTGKLEDGSAAGKQKPTITATDPTQVSKGKDADVTVTGTGFIAASKVTLGGKAVASAFKTATTLVVNLKAADLPTAGEFDLVVTNPAPGGPSDPKKLKVV